MIAVDSHITAMWETKSYVLYYQTNSISFFFFLFFGKNKQTGKEEGIRIPYNNSEVGKPFPIFSYLQGRMRNIFMGFLKGGPSGKSGS